MVGMMPFPGPGGALPGVLGRIGERILERLGGVSKVALKTSSGKWRFIDQLVDGIAHESKTGYTYLTDFVKMQIDKDFDLLSNGQVQGVIWHFFESPWTGKIGLSPELAAYLTEKGITWTVGPLGGG